MKTYTFKVVIEPDEDRWFAYCPSLVEQGASTWGYTQSEALKNLDEVVKMVVASLLEHGEALPDGPPGQVSVTEDPLVAVTI